MLPVHIATRMAMAVVIVIMVMLTAAMVPATMMAAITMMWVKGAIGIIIVGAVVATAHECLHYLVAAGQHRVNRIDTQA